MGNLDASRDLYVSGLSAVADVALSTHRSCHKCAFPHEWCILSGEVFFSMYSPLLLLLKTSSFWPQLGVVRVHKIKKHQNACSRKYTNIGPHFCPYQLDSGGNEAAVSIFHYTQPVPTYVPYYNR